MYNGKKYGIDKNSTVNNSEIGGGEIKFVGKKYGTFSSTKYNVVKNSEIDAGKTFVSEKNTAYSLVAINNNVNNSEISHFLSEKNTARFHRQNTMS